MTALTPPSVSDYQYGRYAVHRSDSEEKAWTLTDVIFTDGTARPLSIPLEAYDGAVNEQECLLITLAAPFTKSASAIPSVSGGSQTYMATKSQNDTRAEAFL